MASNTAIASEIKAIAVQGKLLRKIQEMRESDPELCDITFLVGRSETSRQSITANSTILALASPYFKAMCFGPLRSNEPKVINDMEPQTFERILDFAHVGPRSCVFETPEEAWETRYAAAQFLMDDLVQACDDYLQSTLNFRSALVLLSKAAANGAEDFKKKIYNVIKHRYAYICSSPDIKNLELPELIDLIKLYKNARTDYPMNAIFLWSEGLDNEEKFCDIFHTYMFKHIRWDNLSNEHMIKIHEMGVLSMELENEVMLKMLARTTEPPEEKSKSVCHMQLFLSKHRNIQPVYLSRIYMRALNAYKGMNGTWSSKDECLVLDNDGMSTLKEVLKSKPLPPYEIDEDDVELECAINNHGKDFVENLKVYAYHIRLDNKDTWFFELKFKPIFFGEKLESTPGGRPDEKGVNSLMFEASFRPELFLDLSDFAVPLAPNVPPLTKIEKVASKFDKVAGFVGPLDVLGKSWHTKVDGKIVLCNDDLNPKYFFQDGAGVPVFCQIN